MINQTLQIKIDNLTKNNITQKKSMPKSMSSGQTKELEQQTATLQSQIQKEKGNYKQLTTQKNEQARGFQSMFENLNDQTRDNHHYKVTINQMNNDL